MQKLIDLICERDQVCSCWVDKIGKWEYSDCCYRHDIACGAILSRADDKLEVDRLYADKLLYRCVKHRAGVVLAGIMFAGARIGAWLGYGTSDIEDAEKAKLTNSV